MMKFRILLLILVVCFTAQLKAQTTEVYGKVIDGDTKEALGYVNIRMVGSLKGVISDPKGEFRIRTIDRVDSINFSFLGFQSRTVAIKRGVSQELNIEMGTSELKLIEVTVKAGKRKKREIDTAANFVFYQVLRHKEQNHANNFVNFKYESYDKFQISLLNPGPKLLNFSLLKPFRFVFENRDTTETGSLYIPGVIRESISDVYSQTIPKKRVKTIIKADKMSGIDNPSVVNLVRVEFGETDPYDNLYYFANTFFSAPFAPVGITTYYYYLTDTLKINGRVSYKLHFVGRAKEDLALKGYAWIDSATWAIKSIVFRPNEKANLNFINEYDAKIDFDLVEDKYWLKSGESMRSVGSLFKKKGKLGMLVEKTLIRRNYELNVVFPDSIMAGVEELVTLEGARKRGKAFWDSSRFIPLTRSQKQVFVISDTIKRVPAWKAYEFFGVFFTSAFADAGPISIGRMLNVVSRNNVEGWRFRLGFQTNPRFRRGTPLNDFLRKFYFIGYGAYGFKDKDIKYNLLSRINLPRKNDRWQVLEVMYRYDMRVPGQDEAQTLITFDNILSLISGRTLSKIMKVREFKISYEKDWVKDFSTVMSFNEKTYYDIPGTFNFSRNIRGVPTNIPNFTVTEFMLDTRYSYRDLAIGGVFYRYFQNNIYPVVMLRYTAGLVAMQGDNFNYHQLQFTLKQKLVSAAGFTLYSIKAAKIFGRVPYTSSFLTQGNTGVLLDRLNYNLLREFEFATDQYAQVWIEHHFMGFFLNKIPGINRLRLREVLIFKGLMGSFDKRNNQALTLPTELGAPNKLPYIELGFGIENIAYIFRVDFLWRATYRNNGGQNFGVKFVLQPRF